MCMLHAIRQYDGEKMVWPLTKVRQFGFCQIEMHVVILVDALIWILGVVSFIAVVWINENYAEKPGYFLTNSCVRGISSAG